MSNSKKKGVKRLGKPHRLNYNETLRATKVHAFVPPEEFKPWWQRYKYCIEPKLTGKK